MSEISDLEAYRQLREYLRKRGIRIVTIASNANIGSNINVYHFARYVPLSMDGIRSVYYDNRGVNKIVRSIIPMKRKKPAKKAFFNQTTIRIKPNTDPNADEINVKVFKNSSLQITGCKDMEDYFDVLERLKVILKNGVRTKIQGELTDVEFAVEPEKLEVCKIVIRLIVSCFNLDYCIDRRHLARILKTNHSLHSKEGYIKFKNGTNSKHSCINIKYQYDAKTTISIFIFYTGSIIITAAQSIPQIISAYEYVMRILNRYKESTRAYIYDKNVIKRMAQQCGFVN